MIARMVVPPIAIKPVVAIVPIVVPTTAPIVVDIGPIVLPKTVPLAPIVNAARKVIVDPITVARTTRPIIAWPPLFSTSTFTRA
jgi:hypothetical protein